MAKNIDIMGQIDIPGGPMKKGLSVLKCSQVFTRARARWKIEQSKIENGARGFAWKKLL